MSTAQSVNDSHCSAPREAQGVLVAIDGGGSKTEAVAFRADGCVLARVRVGMPLNPNGAPEESVNAMDEVARRLRTVLGLEAIEHVFIGVAGGSASSVQDKLSAQVRRLFPALKQVITTHDAISALWCGGGTLPRLSLIAGTGTVAYGLDGEGREFRVGGWGYLIADEGGGYDLGRRALKAIMAEHDGSGEPTGLTQAIMDCWSVPDVKALIPLAYEGGRTRIASLSSLVCEAAAGGDAVAKRLIDGAANDLVALLVDAIKVSDRAAEGAAKSVEVILTGGLWGSAWFLKKFKSVLEESGVATRVMLTAPSMPPVLGGAIYLLDQLGLDTETNTKARLEQTFSRCEEVACTSADAIQEAGVDRHANPLSGLGTESSDPALYDLDARDTLSIVKLIADSNQHAVSAVKREATSIADAIDAISARLSAGGKLYYVGAGTSGRLGVLDAAECPPTFGVSPEKVQGIIAGGESALLHPSEGAEDNEAQGGLDLKSRGVAPGDVVVAIAASGRTPYCMGALKEARSCGALTVSLACNKGAAFSAYADHPIEVSTGAEIIAGSTRMKAGTAQKVVLNMFSTIAMIHMGKVFHGRMVDMVPSNEKLKIRARGIVMHAGGVASESAATELLAQANGEMKTAIIMARIGVDATQARQLLEESQGHIRRALEAYNADWGTDL